MERQLRHAEQLDARQKSVLLKGQYSAALHQGNGGDHDVSSSNARTTPEGRSSPRGPQVDALSEAKRIIKAFNQSGLLPAGQQV